MFSKIKKKIIRHFDNKKKFDDCDEEKYPKIIELIVGYWLKIGIIENCDKDHCKYGLDSILSSALNIMVVLIMGIFIKRLPESIALLSVVIPLQSMGGGYHAKTRLHCFFIWVIGWWVVIGIIPYITLLSAIFIACTSLVTIFILAPVSHENAPMNKEQIFKMKRILRYFSIVTAVVGIVVSYQTVVSDVIGNSMVMGMGVVALSILVGMLCKKIGRSRRFNTMVSRFW